MSFDRFHQRLHADTTDDRLGQALVRLSTSPIHAVVSSGDDDPTTNGSWTVWSDGGGASGE